VFGDRFRIRTSSIMRRRSGVIGDSSVGQIHTLAKVRFKLTVDHVPDMARG